jgi:hypothetical protein
MNPPLNLDDLRADCAAFNCASGYFVLRTPRELDRIVLNKNARLFISITSRVMPPYSTSRISSLHAVGTARIVHFNDQKILAVVRKRIRLKIERREPTFVPPSTSPL